MSQWVVFFRRACLVFALLLGSSFLASKASDTGQPVTRDALDSSLARQSLVQVNINGFGDRQNSISWSMLWWRGKLYVGTSRAALCLRELGWGREYPPPDPDVECPEDPLDLPLQAEIWRYTPGGDGWELVYRSPEDLEIPGHPGRFVARDIGYRDMMVFKEPDGTEAMYVSGVSARFIYPELPPPRLLRSTDGLNFQPVPQAPGTMLGDFTGNNFRSMGSFQDRFYVTAGGAWGDGVLLESEDPAQGNDSFRQVTPPGFRVFSVETFNGQLYVGTTNWVQGYGIYRTDATGDVPYEFTPVVTRSAFHPGTPDRPHSVISMETFQGKLYAGTDGPLDVIRVYADDSWDLIVGEPRWTPQGLKLPLSTLGPRFDWPYNILTWRMGVHNDTLFIGAFDVSTFLKDVPVLGELLRPFMGAKVYASSDGVQFVLLGKNFFDGDFFNYGVRSFVSTPHGLFIGTANEWYGTEVWKLVGP